VARRSRGIANPIRNRIVAVAGRAYAVRRRVDVADSPRRFLECWTGIESTTVGGDDLVFQWYLETLDGGTKISVHVDIPESEAARLDLQRDVITSTLGKLGTLAAASAV